MYSISFDISATSIVMYQNRFDNDVAKDVAIDVALEKNSKNALCLDSIPFSNNIFFG